MRFSLEAEQSVIGALMLDPEALGDVLDVISEQDFYSAAHRIIFGAIASIAAANQPVDVVTVCEKLTSGEQLDAVGGFGYVTDLAGNVSSTSNVLAYAKIVGERSLERKMVEAGRAICEIGDNALMELDAKLSAVQAEVSLLDARDDAVVTNFNSLLKGRVQALDARFRGGVITGLKTGFTALDERFDGLDPGVLWILAARPSMGKTTLALNLAQNAVNQGVDVLIFSLEMSKEQLADKLICAAAGMNFKKFRSGKLEESDWPQLESGARRLKDKNIHIIDTPAIDVKRATRIANKYAKNGKLGLIVIDYLQLMTCKSESRFDEISTISRNLKVMAKLCGCPVLALSQLSRKCEERGDRRPMNSDLRESGQIEQDADIISFIYRDEVYFPDSNLKGVAEIITSKNREGETGTDGLCAALAKSRFENLAYEFTREEQKPYAPKKSRGFE